MSLLAILQNLAGRAAEQSSHLTTVEATRNALVLPFFQALGYDVFDPTRFLPEPGPECGFNATVRPDFLVLQEGRPVLMVECRKAGDEFGEIAASRIAWSFEATEARLAVLTNGLRYLFFTDLVNPGHMDESPILEVDLRNLEAAAAERLEAFRQGALDSDAIRKAAADIRHLLPELTALLEGQMWDPAPELARFFLERTHSGPVTPQMVGQFQGMLAAAFRQAVKTRVRERLLQALEREGPVVAHLADPNPAPAPSAPMDPAPLPRPEAENPWALEPQPLETEWIPEPRRQTPKLPWVLGSVLLLAALGGALYYGVPRWKRTPTAPPAAGILVQGDAANLPKLPVQPGLAVPAQAGAELAAPPAPAPKPTLAALVAKGDLAAATELGQAHAATLPKGHLALRLAIAAEPKTVQNVLTALPGREGDLFLAPIQMKDGRTCHQVFLGSFPTEQAAREASAALPDLFKGPGRPMTFPISQLPVRQ